MAKKVKANPCEFCGALVIYRHLDSTVCNVCDESMEREQNAKLEEKAHAWGVKHKCQQCRKPLPLSRYYNCGECLRDHELTSESEWDGFDYIIDDEDRKQGASLDTACAKLRAPAFDHLPKKCNYCGLLKERSDFHYHKGTKDGRRGHCKHCQNNAEKRNKEVRLAKLQRPTAST